MRYLFVGPRTLPLAMRVQNEGHKVFLLTSGVEGEGLVEKANQHFISNPAVDIAVVDGPGLGVTVDHLTNRGVKVIGSSRLTDHASESAVYLKALMRSLKYKVGKPENTDILIEGWFNGSHVCQPIGVSQVSWNFMEGDIGPDIGGAGAWLQLKRDESIFAPLERVLMKHPYRGPVVLRMGVDGVAKHISFHFNWTSTTAYLDSLATPIGDLLRIVANGSSDEFDQKGLGQTISVLVTIPPFPYGNVGAHGLPINLQNGAWPHIWCGDLLSLDGRVITAGTRGVIGWVTATARNVSEARKRAYRDVKQIRKSLPNIQYRRDIGRN